MFLTCHLDMLHGDREALTTQREWKLTQEVTQSQASLPASHEKCAKNQRIAFFHVWSVKPFFIVSLPALKVPIRKVSASFLQFLKEICSNSCVSQDNKTISFMSKNNLHAKHAWLLSFPGLSILCRDFSSMNNNDMITAHITNNRWEDIHHHICVIQFLLTVSFESKVVHWIQWLCVHNETCTNMLSKYGVSWVKLVM